jgi:hypothetical protein
VKGSFASVVSALCVAEAQIVLLARSHPTNWLELQSRLTEQWKSGQPEEPVFQFAVPPDLSKLRRALDLLEKWSVAQGPWGQIFAARCRELQLEAEIVEHVGTPKIRDLAQLRFTLESDAQAESLGQLARNWVQLEPSSETTDPIRSDDERDDRSLICQMRRELESCGFSFPVKLEGRLASRASVDDKFVWLKPQVYLSAKESKRIVIHEVHGHVARRVAVLSRENAGYACGTAGADADEEGRALWLEDAAGLLDSTRKVEIGGRHLAAQACRQGATFSDGVRLLAELNTPIERAITMALRVWRGGGVAREIVYLDAFCRAQKALSESTEIEWWMKRGRISFGVADRLAQGTLKPLD